MKKVNRIILIATAVLLTFLLSSCAEKTEDKILGSWYTDNMQELFFSEDGTYTVYDEGGTYSVDGNRITLIDPLGGVLTLEYYDDGDEAYLYEPDGYREFYPYDWAYEIYSEKIAAAEESRTSTVDDLRAFFVGKWESKKSVNAYAPQHYHHEIIIRDDGTFTVSDPDYKSDVEGTWEFVEDWNPERYCFKAYPTYADGKTYEDETSFYIPDWEDGDFSNVELFICDSTVVKIE